MEDRMGAFPVREWGQLLPRGAAIKGVGQAFRTLRKARGLTMADLQKRTGVFGPVISNFENGNSGVEILTLFLLLDGLQAKGSDFEAFMAAFRRDRRECEQRMRACKRAAKTIKGGGSHATH